MRASKSHCARPTGVTTINFQFGGTNTPASGPLSFGKILIQRDEVTCLPALLYSKFPSGLAEQGNTATFDGDYVPLANMVVSGLGSGTHTRDRRLNLHSYRPYHRERRP